MITVEEDIMVTHHIFEYEDEFVLENGQSLPGFELFYTTYGKLNKNKDNVIWVCHAFTGGSDFTQWWSGMFGEGKCYDPNKHFMICANMLGGCYGSTGPLSKNVKTGQPYYHTFPQITNNDVIRAFDLLREDFGFEKIHTLIGCSLGGQQALEWAVHQPDRFERLIVIGANAKQSAWGVAFNETQRMAIENDITWQLDTESAGMNGMKVARAVALISYRNYRIYQKKQSYDDDRVDEFKASSYQNYQGDKLTKRFNAFTYWYLSKAMDAHNVGRNRDGVENALKRITAQSLFIGVETDELFPIFEQKYLAKHVEGGSFDQIQSDYGHDGFLIEADQLTNCIHQFYKNVENEKKLVQG